MERQKPGYVDNDKISMRELAGLYDADIPVHENTEYVEMSKALLASHGGPHARQQ